MLVLIHVYDKEGLFNKCRCYQKCQIFSLQVGVYLDIPVLISVKVLQFVFSPTGFNCISFSKKVMLLSNSVRRIAIFLVCFACNLTCFHLVKKLHIGRNVTHFLFASCLLKSFNFILSTFSIATNFKIK